MGEDGGQRLGLPLRVYGHLMRVLGWFELALYVILAVLEGLLFALSGSVDFQFNGSLAGVLDVLSTVWGVLVSVALIVLGRDLVKSRRRDVAIWARRLLAATVVEAVMAVMQAGVSAGFASTIVQLVMLTVLSLKIDPQLNEQRRARGAAAIEDDVRRAAEGTLGRDKSGRGYLSLNFYNLFWIFVVGCVVGLILETLWHPLVVEPGVWQDRAGMLYGPFSPIYGFGAVLLTVALNRLYNKSFVLVFVASAVIGGGFEFFVSWFFQTAFGITAWDYTGTFLSIDGRTNGFFMAVWGVLGLVFIKLLLPVMLRGINVIPVRQRGIVTTVCAALMVVNGVMTLQSIDCWFMRTSGIPATTPIERFYDEHYGDDVMRARFQSMTIVPSESAREDAALRAAQEGQR